MNWKNNVILVAALSSLLTSSLHAQSSAFTYQGRLDAGNNPASGTYDLSFSLYSVSTGSGQIGSTITKSATAVTNGLFTVTLDFGNQFTGANRWLEIGVRTNGASVFDILSPRQALTSTPHAITAASVSGPVAASSLTGSVPSSALTSVPAGNLTGAVPSGALTSVPAASLTGSVSDSRLSGNVALRAGGNAFTGDQTIAGNVGIGTATPNANLEVASPSTAEIVASAHNSIALFAGQVANGSSASPSAVGLGNDLAWFAGRGHDGQNYSGTRAAMILSASQTWSPTAHGTELSLATTANNTTTRTERMRIANNGFVGIGTATPLAPLQVSGGNPQIYVTATGGGFAQFIGESANGSPESPTAVTSGQDLAWFGAHGHDGSGYSATRAAMIMKASQDWTSTRNGAELLFATTANNTTTRTERMRIANNGFVGIGTATPLAPLQVSGGNPQIYVTATGGGFAQFLKDVNLNFNRGLEAMGKIQPVHYHYKAGNPLELPSEQDYVGVVAQQVEQAVPEAVERTEDGYLVVNNDPIMWTMFNAIKELNQKVDEKDARIKKQDAENEALKARLDRLEQLLNTQITPLQ
jgi:uncharacterized membrane protein